MNLSINLDNVCLGNNSKEVMDDNIHEQHSIEVKANLLKNLEYTAKRTK